MSAGYPGFWNFNAGHALTITSVVAGGFWVAADMRADQRLLAAGQVVQQQQITELKLAIEHGSQLAITVAEHNVRLIQLERKTER